MNLNLTGTLGNVLDVFSGLFSKEGLTYELFECSTVTGKISLGLLAGKCFAMTGDDETTQQIFITDDALVAAAATAMRTVVTQPNIGDGIAVGGKIYEFVASGAVGDQINIGSDAAHTATNIAAKVNTDTVAALCTALCTGEVITFTANQAGTNDIDLVSDGVRITGTAFDGGTPTLASIMKSPTHIRIGELYYKIDGAPDQPRESLDAIRYWLIRCAHTGQRRPS